MDNQARIVKNRALRGIETGLKGLLSEYKDKPSDLQLSAIYATTVGYLGVRLSLIEESTSYLDRVPEMQEKAVRGVAVFIGRELGRQISNLNILQGLQRATDVQIAIADGDEKKIKELRTIRSIIPGFIKPNEEASAHETPSKQVSKTNEKRKRRPYSRRTKKSRENNRRTPRIFIIQKDGGDSHATLNGRTISMKPFELKVLAELIKNRSFAVAISSEDEGIVKSAIRRIRKITGSSISVKQEGGRRIYSLTTSIDYVTRTKEEIASDEVLRNAQKKNALLKLLESIDDITPEKVNSILDMIPSTRLGRKRKSFKATPQVAQVGFATLIARLTNPNSDAQKLDDTDRAIVGKIFEYMERNPEIRSLNEFNKLIAAKFGMKASGYTIYQEYGNYTLAQLNVLYKDDEKRVLRADSIHKDEALLKEHHLYREKLNKTIRRVIELFPVKGSGGEESLELQRFRLGDELKNQYHMPFSIDFLQSLVNKNIFSLPKIMNGRVTDRLHLNRAQIAYVLFLKMRQPDEKAKILELPTEAQNALMRIIVHDLPQVIEELRKHSAERIRPLSMNQVQR